MNEKFLTVSEVAGTFNVRPETILRWIHRGRIAAIALQGGHYRISESELTKITQIQAPLTQPK